MFVDEPYITLLASLPYLPIPGAGKQLPITRRQLKNRLLWLTSEDRDRLHSLDMALHWEHLPINLNDAQMMERANIALAAINSDFLRAIILERWELRTFVAALRRRVRNEPLPRDQPWGLGRFVGQIENHFNDPSFGLEHLYPWIAQAGKHLQANEPLALENLMIMESWKILDRVDDRHGFDFNAVALYVMRWEILHRYIHRQSEKAMTRFDTLVAHALDDSDISLEALL